MSTLAKLISEAIRATAEKERAFASCEYDRDHFCWREIDAECVAHESLEQGVRELVRDEIAKNKEQP
jgi:hypothetical protein